MVTSVVSVNLKDVSERVKSGFECYNFVMGLLFNLTPSDQTIIIGKHERKQQSCTLHLTAHVPIDIDPTWSSGWREQTNNQTNTYSIIGEFERQKT